MFRLTILGRIGRDAEIKEVRNNRDKKFITFSVCHTSKWKDSDGVTHEKSHWVEVTSNQVSIAPYIRTGEMIFVEGTPTAEGWNDKEGKANATMKLSADQITLCGGKKD